MKSQESRKQHLKREGRIKVYFLLLILGFAILAATGGEYIFLIAFAFTAVIIFFTGLVRSYLPTNDREAKLLRYTERPFGIIAFGLLLFVIASLILNKFF